MLMLTGAAANDDRVDGLELGADDYLAKPFDVRGFVARIRALGRRAPPSVPPVLERGDVVPDPAHRGATRVGGSRADAQGVRGARAAARREGACRLAEELLERVWDENADPFTTR